MRVIVRYVADVFKSVVPVLFSGIVAAGVVLGLIAPAPAFADSAEVRLRAVFYPANVIPPSDGKTDPRFKPEDLQAYLKDVSTRITTGHPLYFACVYDLTNPTPDCNPTKADALITTQFAPDPKSKDPAHPDWLLTMRSLDMVNGRVIATRSFGPLTDAALVAAGTTLATAFGGLGPNADEISALIGTAAIRNNRLSLFQGYEPYIQLVPTLSDSNQPTYLPLMANLLDRRGLPSVPSQFNAGVVASGNTPLDTICGRGQRYLVYGLSSDEYPHQVSLSTRVQTHASAQLYDCTSMSVIPVGLDQHVNVLTTKGPLTSLLSIIQAAFFWQAKEVSPVPLNVIGLVSPYVDTVPGSDPVRRSVADRALQGLVDRLCAKLDEAPTPAPTPIPAPIVISVPVAATPPSIPMLQQQLLQSYIDQTKQQKMVQSAKDGKTKKAAVKTLNAMGVRVQANLNALKHAQAAALGGPAAESTPAPPTNATPAQPASQQQTALVSLDVSGFVSASPPPLKCNPNTKTLDRWSDTPADPTRWKQP